MTEEEVKVERRRLICPRCGRKTKVYECYPGARGVRKLCDRCQRVQEDGLDRYCGPKSKRRSPARPPTICRPSGPVHLCASKFELAVANAAADRCPAVTGVVPVLAYDAAPWGGIPAYSFTRRRRP